ncbi:hypothetical protein LTR85_001725 [Meristemomyces frigidus]|nr:hypothetical protein LTR85_001725 [Meristemomyces frigidus]
MTLTDYALDYDQCSVQELRSFVEARTGEVITGTAQDDYYADRLTQADGESTYELLDLAEWKAPYIAALRRADDTATFCFLDLPAELRNMVYDELLLLKHKDDREYCSPSILAACRQTHDEGEGILYEDNVVNLDFCYLGSHMTIGNEQVDWRAFGVANIGSRLRSINLALWHLHYFLLQTRNVQDLQLYVESDQPLDADRLRDVLSPARLMAPTIKVTTASLVPLTVRSLPAAMSPAPLGPSAGELLARYQRIVSLNRPNWWIPASSNRDEKMKRELIYRASYLMAFGDGSGLMTVGVDAQLHRLLRAVDAYEVDQGLKAKEEPSKEGIVDDRGTMLRWLQCGIKLVTARFALDYAACTLDELRKFARDRNLRTSSELTSNSRALVSLLHLVDEHTSFRFEDLPPELRNLVYSELLTLRNKSGRGFCFPEVLRASKKTCAEASAILYEDNQLPISIDVRSPNDSLRVNNVEIEYALGSGIAEPLHGWPQYIQRFRRFEIKIRLDTDASARRLQYRLYEPLFAANAQLYSLSCFLAHRSHVKHLDIRWFSSPTDGLSADRIAECLWAICRLCPRDGVRFAGLKSETCAKIREYMLPNAPPSTARNTAERFMLYQKEAITVQQHARTIRLSEARREGLDNKLAKARSAAFSVGIITAERHQRTRESTEALVKCIKRTHGSCERHDTGTDDEDDSDPGGRRITYEEMCDMQREI